METAQKSDQLQEATYDSFSSAQGIPARPLLGAHTFRHTAAAQMVNRGASFKEVADVLGHQSLQTTGLYAKLDLDVLAAVALPWQGEVL